MSAGASVRRCGVPGVIAIPCLSWMWSQAVAAQYQLAAAAPPGTQIIFEASENSSIAKKRNAVVEAFLTNAPPSAEWLCFVDSDMAPPADAIERLLAWEQLIVSALCYSRVPPFLSCAGFDGETPGTTRRLQSPDPNLPTLREVDFAGAGCLLVRRHALERIPAPWFDHPAGHVGSGEDAHFCRQARAAGIPIYCDTSLVVPHLGVVGVDRAFAETWRAAHALESSPPRP